MKYGKKDISIYLRTVNETLLAKCFKVTFLSFGLAVSWEMCLTSTENDGRKQNN